MSSRRQVIDAKREIVGLKTELGSERCAGLRQGGPTPRRGQNEDETKTDKDESSD